MRKGRKSVTPPKRTINAISSSAISRWTRRISPGKFCGLADPRKLFSREHVYNSGSTHPRLHDHKAGVIVGHLTNDCGLDAKWMVPHRSEHRTGSFGCHDR